MLLSMTMTRGNNVKYGRNIIKWIKTWEKKNQQHKNKLNDVTNFSNSIAVARPTFAADGKLAIRWDPINWFNPATCLWMFRVKTCFPMSYYVTVNVVYFNKFLVTWYESNWAVNVFVYFIYNGYSYLCTDICWSLLH